MGKTDTEKYASAFGRALAGYLESKSITQSELASAAGLSTPYLNHTMAGRKRASPSFVDRTADTLKLGSEERLELHRAAAIDAGYKLDLSVKKRHR